MPHGTFYLSEHFVAQNDAFPEEPEAIIDKIAAELGLRPGEIELFKSDMRPLSGKPLDVELRIDTDQTEGKRDLFTPARRLYWYLRGLYEIREDMTVGVWLRFNGGGHFIGVDQAGERPKA